jgi:SAM-dependent methyltransferase
MNIKHLDTRITVTDFLCSLVKDKSVLDVGCVAHTATEEASEFWVHRHLVRHAKSVLGTDILREDVEQLQSRGYNIVCADAMSDSLDRKFDVIVLGEIIEHLVNPGGLLTNMRRHLAEDGIVVLTTPHPFFLFNLLHSMFSPKRTLWHPDHVAWYCPFTLRGMLHKTGFDMEVCYYATRSRKLRRLLSLLRIPCFGWMAMTIIAVARPSASGGPLSASP